MKSVLKEVVDQENIWRPSLVDVAKASIGEPVYGNLDILGWVVVKRSNPHVDYQRWDISNELINIVWKDQSSWKQIGQSYTGKKVTKRTAKNSKPLEDCVFQNGVRILPKNIESRELKYNSLQVDKYNLMSLREVPGVVSTREQKYPRGLPEEQYDTLPILTGMLKSNLVLANLFLRKFIDVDVKYKYWGLNFLRNRNFVMEQYIHRDFYDPRRDSCP